MKWCSNPSASAFAFSLTNFCSNLYLMRNRTKSPFRPTFSLVKPTFVIFSTFILIEVSLFSVSLCYGRVAYNLWPRNELFCTTSATFEWNAKCYCVHQLKIMTSAIHSDTTHTFSIYHSLTHTHTHKHTSLIP